MGWKWACKVRLTRTINSQWLDQDGGWSIWIPAFAGILHAGCDQHHGRRKCPHTVTWKPA